MSDRPAFLVIDIETVVDGRLVQRVRYPTEPNLSPAEAVKRYREQLLAASGGKSDFVPHTFHLPVSVAIAKVAEDYALMEVRTLDRPKFRPQVIARSFWRGWEKYGRPTIVTFNGRFFDMPVLEMSAFRFGIGVPSWFTTDGPGYSQPRNRFNTSAHLDLQDFLTNQGATHAHGGLNLLAQLVGGVGKLDTKGDMVQELWETGERERIDDYCMCDVLDTYFVFLRCRALQGHISADAERQLWERARRIMDDLAPRGVALAEYARRASRRECPGDDEDAFPA